MKTEYDDLNLKYVTSANDKNELEEQYDNKIKQFKRALEQRQLEFEDLQQKVIPSLDHDMLRIKIINELEAPHRQQIENKDFQIEHLKDENYKLKRELDLATVKNDSLQ